MSRPAVLAIAGQLDTDQQSVADVLHRTSTAVTMLGQNWYGQDSAQFASDWAGHSKALHMAADSIAAMAKQARHQAGDQQAASAS